MVLAAKVELDFDEIVGAYAKKSSKISNQLLDVSQLDSAYKFSCGKNPYFTVRAIRKKL